MKLARGDNNALCVTVREGESIGEIVEALGMPDYVGGMRYLLEFESRNINGSTDNHLCAIMFSYPTDGETKAIYWLPRNRRHDPVSAEHEKLLVLRED